MVPTPTASWSYKLILKGKTLMLGCSRLEEFALLCRLQGFGTLDHTINHTNVEWERVSVERYKTTSPLFIHQSLISKCRMGFRREPVMVFEDLMNQHIFGNRYIIDLTTDEPWDQDQSPFRRISKLTTIY